MVQYQFRDRFELYQQLLVFGCDRTLAAWMTTSVPTPSADQSIWRRAATRGLHLT